jgi:protein-tyrosine phosphatase
MVDIHSHILPGLDDGARTLEEAVEMLRVAYENGTTDIVATPHSNLEFAFRPDVVKQKIAELEAAAPVRPRLHRGCDFHLSFDNIQDAFANPSKYTINNRSYLLVEFSDLLIAKAIDEVFARMIAAGMIPVITHPERNMLLMRRVDDMKSWVDRGCLIQVTALSFLGRFGSEARDAARELMKRGLVHVVASDAHDPEDRSPRLTEARLHVAKKYGELRAEQLFVTNPRAVLTGAPVEMFPPAEPARRKWYRFWN